MIKFFRRIRLKLLLENPTERNDSMRAGKFSKYLLYAIGEIFLVVVGILIALQINNYNERQKERNLEIALLSNLSNEIDLDIRQIDHNTQLSEERLGRLQNIIASLKDTDKIDKPNFMEQSFEFVVDQYFKSNCGIFDEAVSSGKMSYVGNERLRQNIFDYYRNAKESDNDVTTRQVTDELITPIFVETLFINPEGFSSLGIDVHDIAKLRPINLEMLKSNKDFWKMVLLKFGSNREQMLRWREIKTQAEAVKQQIDGELGTLMN